MGWNSSLRKSWICSSCISSSGSKGALGTFPLRMNFFFISCSFLENVINIFSRCPRLMVGASPTGQVLDPPLVSIGISQVMGASTLPNCPPKFLHFHTFSAKSNLWQWRIQDFPEEGAPTPKVGAPTYYLVKNFPKTTWKWRIWAHRGYVPLAPPPLRSANVWGCRAPHLGNPRSATGFVLKLRSCLPRCYIFQKRVADKDQKLFFFVLRIRGKDIDIYHVA